MSGAKEVAITVAIVFAVPVLIVAVLTLGMVLIEFAGVAHAWSKEIAKGLMP